MFTNEVQIIGGSVIFWKFSVNAPHQRSNRQSEAGRVELPFVIAEWMEGDDVSLGLANNKGGDAIDVGVATETPLVCQAVCVSQANES